MHIYIYIYIYKYIHIYAHTYIYIYIYTCTRTYIYIYIYIYMYLTSHYFTCVCFRVQGHCHRKPFARPGRWCPGPSPFRHIHGADGPDQGGWVEAEVPWAGTMVGEEPAISILGFPSKGNPHSWMVFMEIPAKGGWWLGVPLWLRKHDFWEAVLAGWKGWRCWSHQEDLIPETELRSFFQSCLGHLGNRIITCSMHIHQHGDEPCLLRWLAAHMQV